MKSHARCTRPSLAVYLGLLLVVFPAVAAASIRVTKTLVSTMGNAKLWPAMSGNTFVFTLGLDTWDIVGETVGEGWFFVSDPFELAHEYYPDIDGTRIVFQKFSCCSGHGIGQPDIYSYDMVTEETEQLTFSASQEQNPVISGDNVVYTSNRIAYVGEIVDGQYDIAVFDFDTGQTIQVTNDGYTKDEPRLDYPYVVWMEYHNKCPACIINRDEPWSLP